MAGDQFLLFNAKLLEEVSCYPGIFADNRITLLESFYCSEGDISEIPDGVATMESMAGIIQYLLYLLGKTGIIPLLMPQKDDNDGVQDELPFEDDEEQSEQSLSDSPLPKAVPLAEEGETIASIGRLAPRPIVNEMEESYLGYAMSVIVSRALPDARDGLKPVHRRILYVMHELGLRSQAKFRKSAAVVGDVMGKYHPHGDSAIYDALARMAQDFSMRHMLINGQGNFGSIDGDNPAAMRYTEAKMQKITEEMLADIEKNTVEFRPNYDGSKKEPSVLPAKVPNLLLNGSVGIAVGMATNMPPHNLGELVDALVHLLEHPDATVEDLLTYVQGPDFPTGGIVYDKEVLKQAYLTGRGSVVVRGKAEIEETKSGGVTKFASMKSLTR